MHFLKLVFGLLLLVAFVFLAASNWYNVPVFVSPGHGAVLVSEQAVVDATGQAAVGAPHNVRIDINLPLLLAATFLIGFLPYFILHRTTRWSLRRKLAQAKRELEASKHPVPVVDPAASSDITTR